MTQTKITFSYEEICDFSQPTVVTVEVPERSIDEMCEYFQRFLLAAGYILDENERIGVVRTERKESLYPAASEDILSFQGWPVSPYNFGGDTVISGSAGADTISFSDHLWG